jgi:geranylgeranyl pyrophosphate synthase
MQSKIIDRDEKIKKVTSIFQQLEVDKKSIELANNYFEKGLALFDQVSAKKANKSEITELITKLMGRER